MKKNALAESRLEERSQLIEQVREQLAEYGIELVIQKKEKLIYKEIETTRFFTVLEVAKKLRISKETVYRYLQSGFLVANKFGHKSWRIEAGELKKFLEEHHMQGMKNRAENYWTLKKPKKRGGT